MLSSEREAMPPLYHAVPLLFCPSKKRPLQALLLAAGGSFPLCVFVRYQIRFIALNNGIDTATSHMNTTSVNVRGTLNVNREQGKCTGSFAAYGYLKDPADHHRLSSSFNSIPRRFSLRESFEIGTYLLKCYRINPGTFQWDS